MSSENTIRTESGQSLVEFALVITFVFLLIISILQMILVMYAYVTLGNAAKEGVRYAIVHGTQNSNCSGPSTSAICATSDTSANNVKQQVANFAVASMQSVTTSEVTVNYFSNTTTSANPCSNPGCIVQVTVSHQFFPLFGLGWPNFTLNASAQGTIVN